jgi:hypothetical protein
MPGMIRALAIGLLLVATVVTPSLAQSRDVSIAQGIDAEFLDV